MNDLLDPELIRKLVGVIDLKNHQAVHAVAGNRDHYRPVATSGGNPCKLVGHYQQLGVRACYVADLDAIAGRPIQWNCIDQVCQSAAGDQLLLLDLGWTGNESPIIRDSIHALTNRFAMVKFVAATESMQSRSAIVSLAEIVSPSNVLLGLDFRDRQVLGLLSANDWIAEGLANRIAGAVILDLASIGCVAGTSTVQICRDIRKRVGDWLLFSGGGIRNASDAYELIDAGCDWCLVASALHGIL